MADNSAQRSSLKEFLASIATIKGDLSNITAPPFVLADKSTTELPRYWISHPDLFAAPSRIANSTPELRLLAVLKWFLASLKGQQYAGRAPNTGIKKPLNAFLGEVFTGSSGEGGDEASLVSEQVSHHPPVTACYLWNSKAGIRAEGFTRQEVTFNGSVHVKQFGYAVLHLDQHEGEKYLIPLPSVTVKGVLTGGSYPELSEQCHIVSSSGCVAEIDFTGKGMLGFGGEKNHFSAAVYGSADQERKDALFTVEGEWNKALTFKDAEEKVLETYDVAAAGEAEFHTLPLEKQDPFESHKAWDGVISSINKGNMSGVAESKSKLENGQRALRKKAEFSESKWEPVFFRKASGDSEAQALLDRIGKSFDSAQTCGIWKIDEERLKSIEQRPWRGDLTPYG